MSDLSAGDVASATASIYATRKSINALYVIGERAKWRDKIRESVATAMSSASPAAWGTLWLTLSLNTNPFDPDDIALIKIVKKLEEGSPLADLREDLVLSVALLLKHD